MIAPPLPVVPPLPVTELSTQLPLSQCCVDEQLWPQPPQFSASLPLVTTQADPHSVSVVEQFEAQAPLLQT
jgi:hypothetical protein